MEPINLCMTCRKMRECRAKGIFERDTCSEYEPFSLSELLERDRFVQALMVGPCPQCGSEDAYDCENNPLLEDVTVGHCLDCETYWCLECGYVFDKVEKGTQCPHWGICDQCYKEHGYLDVGDFVEKICPTCEHYEDGCLLEDPSQCEKEGEFLCPYHVDVSECPRIEGH